MLTLAPNEEAALVSRRTSNSLSRRSIKLLVDLREPLIITVHLPPEDPRYVDLRRNVLSNLERAMPRVAIRLATMGQSMVGSASDEAYGEIKYSYAGRSDKSRSTSPREIVPLIYALAARPSPAPVAGEEYPGYPLLANGSPALAWFLGGLPVLIVVAWWWSRRPPQIAPQLIKDGGQP
jgi:hypothetical protein